MKYQYQTQAQSLTAGQVHETLFLNQQGALGWELVSVLDQHGSRIYYFKRLLEDFNPSEYEKKYPSPGHQ